MSFFYAIQLRNDSSCVAIFKSSISYLFEKASLHLRIMSLYLLTKNCSIKKWKISGSVAAALPYSAPMHVSLQATRRNEGGFFQKLKIRNDRGGVNVWVWHFGWFLSSGVTDSGQEGRTDRTPDKLNVKIGPTLADILIFSILLVFRRLFWYLTDLTPLL